MTAPSQHGGPTRYRVSSLGSLDDSHSTRVAHFGVLGNSGCQVKIKQHDGNIVITKSALDVRYNQRLKLQVEKQRAFGAANTLPFIRVPRIIAEFEQQGLYGVEMEYVNFHDSLAFFSAASPASVDRVASMLFDYVDRQITSAEMLELPIAILRDKVGSVVRALDSAGSHDIYRPSVTKVMRAIDARHTVQIPVGSCHGDLTFSNILIAPDAGAVALLDFLDSYIESPAIDIAKLRQDTRFHWTLLMSDKISDQIRFKQVMQYFDQRICDRYSTAVWYRSNIDLILGVNMLRIAPYARTPAVQQFLVSCIDALRFTDD